MGWSLKKIDVAQANVRSCRIYSTGSNPIKLIFVLYSYKNIFIYKFLWKLNAFGSSLKLSLY